MTFKQAKENLARTSSKGERGNLVVYANTITKTEEQDDGIRGRAQNPVHEGVQRVQCRADRRICPNTTIRNPTRSLIPQQRIDHADQTFSETTGGRHSPRRKLARTTAAAADHVQMPLFRDLPKP